MSAYQTGLYTVFQTTQAAFAPSTRFQMNIPAFQEPDDNPNDGLSRSLFLLSLGRDDQAIRDLARSRQSTTGMGMSISPSFSPKVNVHLAPRVRKRKSHSIASTGPDPTGPSWFLNLPHPSVRSCKRPLRASIPVRAQTASSQALHAYLLANKISRPRLVPYHPLAEPLRRRAARSTRGASSGFRDPQQSSLAGHHGSSFHHDSTTTNSPPFNTLGLDTTSDQVAIGDADNDHQHTADGHEVDLTSKPEDVEMDDGTAA